VSIRLAQGIRGNAPHLDMLLAQRFERLPAELHGVRRVSLQKGEQAADGGDLAAQVLSLCRIGQRSGGVRGL